MMSNLGSESSVGGGASDGFEALANLNDGFLGTGYSSSVEVSFIASALIFGYVAISMVRYFMPETRFVGAVAEVLGLRDG
jgi:hypothetical protein